MNSLKMSKNLIEMVTTQEIHKSHTLVQLVFSLTQSVSKVPTMGRKFQPLPEVA
jgi:hypothetical protein